jgi:hypothetical protein
VSLTPIKKCQAQGDDDSGQNGQASERQQLLLHQQRQRLGRSIEKRKAESTFEAPKSTDTTLFLVQEIDNSNMVECILGVWHLVAAGLMAFICDFASSF